MNANNRSGPARLASDGLIRYLKAQGEKLPARHVAMLWNCVDGLALTERRIAQAERGIAIRTDDHVRRIFLRFAKRSGRKAAAVAVARKLLTCMHSAVVKGETYRGAKAA